MTSRNLKDTSTSKKDFYNHQPANKIRASLLAREIGDKLVSEHPEIANFYRCEKDFQTYMHIANHYVTNAQKFPQVALRAVGYAIQQLIPQEELAEIRRERRTQQLEDLFDGFDSETFRAHCSKAATKRHELGVGVDTDAMIKALGRTPWTDDEKQHALDLSKNPTYQHIKGQHKEKPHYKLIALVLNETHHNNESIRYTNSVASFIRGQRRTT
jgi:hypothetical protein